jgi:hypothetical protein
MTPAEETQVQPKDGAFTATQWTQIRLAAETSSPDGQEAQHLTAGILYSDG